MGKYYSVVYSDNYLAHAVGIKAVHNLPLASDVSSPRASYDPKTDQLNITWTLDGKPQRSQITNGYYQTASGGTAVNSGGLQLWINTIKNQGNSMARDRGWRANWDDSRLRQMARNMDAQIKGASADMTTYGRIR